MVHVWRSEDRFFGVTSLLQLLLGFWGSNSGGYMCIVCSFTAELCCQCHYTCLFVHLSIAHAVDGKVTSDNEIIFLCFPLILLLTLNSKSTVLSSRLKENDLPHVLSLQGTASFLESGPLHSATLGSSFNPRINKHS